MSKFYSYFKENMEALGLAAPQELFANAQTAVATASTLLGLVEKFGKKVTVREIAKAGTRLEQLSVVGAALVAYYVGAVIGSLAVATGRSLAGGTSIADVLITAHNHNLRADWLEPVLRSNPGIYNRRLSDKNSWHFSPALA